MTIYRKLPISVRNRYFAKIYWNTHYTMLQRYGTNGKTPIARLRLLKMIAKKYGLRDFGPRNIRTIDGVSKIIDAMPA